MPKKATTLLDVACEAAKAKRDAEKVAASAAFLSIRERDGARELARWNAELATNAVAIMTHRPEMEPAYVGGELPEWFDHLLWTASLRPRTRRVKPAKKPSAGHTMQPLSKRMP